MGLRNEELTIEQLIAEQYDGIRPAPGYPACPDHTEKRLLFDLLEVEKNTDIILTENFAMYPTAAVSGFYFAHPEINLFWCRKNHGGASGGCVEAEREIGFGNAALVVAEFGVTALLTPHRGVMFIE